MRVVCRSNLTVVACVTLALVAASCGESSPGTARSSGGTIVVAATGEPDFLFPPLSSNVPARQVTELIYDRLADIGPKLNVIGDSGFKPVLAQSWQWAADSLSIAFHLNPKARWHDGVPVRAADVVYTHSLYTSPSLGDPMTDDLRNIDSVTARDSLTAVFWFHTRTADEFYTAADLMLIVPRHVFAKMKEDSLRESAARAKPVGSGRFRFVSWTPGISVEISADTSNYRGKPSIDRVIWTVAPEYAGALTKLKGGEADVFDALHAESADEIASNPKLRVVSLPGMDYAFLDFNLRNAQQTGPHPLFGNRELRRALTMALDRAAMVRNVFDTLAVVPVGPTISALPTTSKALRQIPYDTARASRTLDSLGWSGRAADGTRTREGKELAFTMIVPTSSSGRSRMAVLIQSQLRKIGVRADIEMMESQAFLARQSERKFDAALGAWNVTANPSAIREVWTSRAAKPGGRNYGAYISAPFDAALDSAASARTAGAAMRFYTRAYQTIIDDAPAVWLYEPKTVIGIHRRIRTSGLVPGAWWADLADWWIPPSERIPRDNARSAR